jgi:hypothetical protein
MGTVTTLVGGKTAGRTAGSVPYLVDTTIDIAVWAAAEGAPLEDGDIVQAISVPANTLILNAGLEVITAVDGSASADNAWDLGVTGVDPDAFVDGFALDTASAGDYAQNAAAYQPLVIGAADTIDLLCQAATTAPVSGVVRVWAVLMDVDGRYGAEEADRDQLA